MGYGMMQELIDKIKKQYPTLTNKKGESERYVYIVKSQEVLIDVGRSSRNSEVALTGHITDVKHTKSGIAMMASAFNNRMMNNIYYVPTTKTKAADIEKELKQIEKNIKSIVLSHYKIPDKNAGTIFYTGSTNNKDVANSLKRLLHENLSPGTLKELNEPKFSFIELLDMVTEEGDDWHNIIKNKKSAQLACKFLGIRQQS